MRYRKPEELKESGIEWIGKIPNNWSLTKIKRGYKVQLGKMLQSEPQKENETKERYLRAANITWKSVDYSDIKKMWFSPEEKEKYNLKDYDLLVTEGGDVGRSTIFINNDSGKYFYQNALNRVRGRNNNKTAFLYYWIYTLKHCGYIDLICGKSTIAHLTAEKLERLPIYLPTKPEQRAIAAFLDRKTESIDQLIQKKEQLIERLKEKRQALITRAVTKGLDSDVPMKDSGIEWLGEIPEGWELIKFKYVIDLVNDSVDDSKFSIALENIESWTGDYIETDSNYSASGTLFSEGDILFGKLRPYLAKVYLANQKGKAIGDIYIFRGKKLIPKYLFMIVDSKAFIDMVNSSTYGAKMPRASWDFIGELKFPIPNIEKQKEIVRSVESSLSSSENIIDKIDEEIQLLKEYRQSLISGAVTGKIDVHPTYAEVSADRDEVEAEEDKQTAQTANIYFKRRVLAAKILDELYMEPTMGRRKLQKILYLLEMEIEGLKLKSQYQKDAAGPFDNQMMRSIESQLLENNWFKRVKRESGYGFRYLPMAQKDKYKEYYPRYWGEFRTEIDDYLNLFRKQKTHLLSLVATLYACWNDFIIRDEEFDGKKLIYEARYNWHEEKKEIPYKDWKKALKWMWNNDLKPQGTGELTKEKN